MVCERRSRPPSNKDLAALVLPSSLSRVSPFLQEAQSCFRDETKADSKIVVYCVDHAVSCFFLFINITNLYNSVVDIVLLHNPCCRFHLLSVSLTS